MDIKTLRRTKKYEEMRKPDTKIHNVFMNSPCINYFKQLTIILVAKNLHIYKLISFNDTIFPTQQAELG
jgi:hypothetical protein